MSEIKTAVWTLEDITEFGNQVKDLLASNCQCPQLDNYIVVIAKRNMFGRVWAKLWKPEETCFYIRIVKAKELKDG